MNRTAWMLLGLLLVSNAAWWVASRGACAVAPTSVAPPAGDDAAALAQALARIQELESRPTAATARASDSRTTASTSPQVAPSEMSSEPQLDPREQRASELANAWCAEARQIESATRRESALAEIRAALLSDDPVVVLAALRAYAVLHDLDFDRALFRPLVLPLLEAEDAGVRAEATRSLGTFLDRRGDLPLVLARLEDPAPDVRWWAASRLGEFKGAEVDSAALRLLEDPDRRVRITVLRNVTQTRMDDALEARVLQLASDPATRDEVISSVSIGGATSPALIDLLVDAAFHGSGPSAHHARMTLSTIVPEPCRARVASAFLEFVTDSGSNRHGSLRVVGDNGDASHLPALEALAANTLASDSLRRDASAAIAEIRERVGG